MTAGSSARLVDGAEFLIDESVAHPARVYDYLAGGTDHFAVDRRIGERVFEPYPDGVRTARQDVRANREFLDRAVRYLAVETGIDQFLDVGTGIPTEDGHSVHEVVRPVAPRARVVYVDNDPIVLAHAHRLLDKLPVGAALFVPADLRDPMHVLDEAAAKLDLARPVAMLLLGVLHFIDDAEDPYALVRELLGRLAPGSHMAVSHLAIDINPDVMAEVAKRSEEQPTRQRATLRDRAAVARFFDGLELLEPGVVRVDEWRPTEPPSAETSGGWRTPIWCGVGRKP